VTEHAAAAAAATPPARWPATTHRPPIELTLPLTSVSYLAIPLTSVTSERVFSLSGRLMTRNRLLPETLVLCF